MQLSYFPNYAARNAAPIMDAFLQGMQRHGVETVLNSRDADIALIWSQLWAGRMKPNQAIYQYRASIRRPTVMIDVGVIKRNETWRIMLDGDAYIAGHGHDCHRRNHMSLTLQDWKFTGSNVVVALQRPDSNQWQSMPDPVSWLTNIVGAIRQHTARPILIRPHPRFAMTGKFLDAKFDLPLRIPDTYDDYDFVRSLQTAWSVVNWNSTPGIISVLNGCPTFVGVSSLAAPVANLDLSCIETPARPNREQWANDLAWTEWTVDEICHGVPQQYILDRVRGQ